MNNSFLEQFYEIVILPQYDISFKNIEWIDHGYVGPDEVAHYFKDGLKHYVLVFHDSPAGGNPFDDGLSHEIIKINNQFGISFNGSLPYKYIENVTGYFELYKEIER